MAEREFSFIIAAGGSGSRMGGQKQFMSLNNKPIWKISAENAAKLDSIKEIILVIPSDYDEKNIIWNNKKKLIITHGGSERSISVLNGLNSASCEFVMVHDAARPFASTELFMRLIETVDENYGVVPVLPVSDALKKIDGENITCINRDGLYITQTPQVFHREKLIEAVKINPYAKDEAESWEKSGRKLKYADGEKMNFKITHKEDMIISKLLTENYITRTGIGYDVHKLVPERKLILGGIEIESELGLLGHSDADLLTHSIMDAILGAANLPDIGNYFPASDMKYKNINSIELLKKVITIIKNNEWHIEFVDAIIEAQVPRLNQYREIIINNLSQFFPVNIKFKSAEKLNDSGLGLSMTCWACATLRRRLDYGSIIEA